MAGSGERALIQSLAECDVEVMALEFAAVFASDADPLARLDPAGPFVTAAPPAPDSAESHSHEHDR
jgi:hypothetical protein